MSEKNAAVQVSRLLREAQLLDLRNKPAAAVKCYLDALALVKEGHADESYTSSIYCNIGQIYWHQQEYEKALKYMELAVNSKGGLGLYLVHLRLGQLRFEQGEIEKAQDELMRAYMAVGPAAFADEDPKYYALIQPHIEHT